MQVFIDKSTFLCYNVLGVVLRCPAIRPGKDPSGKAAPRRRTAAGHRALRPGKLRLRTHTALPKKGSPPGGQRFKPMKEYVIAVDAGCDLPAEKIAELGLVMIPLTVTVDDKEPIPSDQLPAAELYAALRSGKMAKTAAASMGDFLDVFTKLVEEGKDVLYLSLSSGLSSTQHSASLAAAEVEAGHPGCRVIVVDTLCASGGIGYVTLAAARRKAEGMEMEKVAEEIRMILPKVCHQFTVDDLFFLKRGGRVSAVTAFIGTMLQFKPMMHMDDIGKLAVVDKVRGRKTAIRSLCDAMEKTVFKESTETVLITHADCEGDANTLAGLIRERLGMDNILICDIGPTVGAHSGPGTLALFYVGSQR